MTAWFCYNEELKKYEFNHLSDKYENDDKPQPKLDKNGTPFKKQKKWKNSKWIKKYCVLKNNTIEYIK